MNQCKDGVIPIPLPTHTPVEHCLILTVKEPIQESLRFKTSESVAVDIKIVEKPTKHSSVHLNRVKAFNLCHYLCRAIVIHLIPYSNPLLVE